MARKPETMTFSGSLEPLVQKPLDGRRKVTLISDLTAAASFPYIFSGLDVYCEENQKWYTFLGGDQTDINNWRMEGTGGSGTSDYSDLSNKPQINGVTLSGNKTSADLNIGESVVYFDVQHSSRGGEEWQRTWTATELLDEVRAGKDVRIRLRHMNYFGEEPPSYVDVLPMITAYATESGTLDASDSAEFVRVEGWQNSGGSQDLDRQDTMTITVRDYEGRDEMTVARKTVRIPKVPSMAVGYSGYNGEAQFLYTDGTEAMNLLQDSENGNVKVYSEDSNKEWILDTELASKPYADSKAYDDTALAARVTANETAIADRYTKAESDALLADKADKATTYTKAQTDALVEGEHVELTQAQYTALPEEEKMNGKVYFITDGGAYVPAVDLIPYVNQAPIVVGKLDLRGDGEFRDIKRVRLWISDLKNCSTIITVGWPETGVYIRTLRVYGCFTLHKTISGEERIWQYPIPYTAVGYDGAIQFSLNFYVNHQNKLIMDIPFKQSVFHQDDFAQVIIDYIETPIT